MSAAGSPAPLIGRADPDDPRVGGLVVAHLAEMEPTAPACSRHALSVEQLRDPAVRLWVAEGAGELVGSVALKDLGAGHVELKTMRVDPSVRGSGLGRRLLVHALVRARASGAVRVSLETGAGGAFVPARTLYLAHGFAPCEPFGDYRPDPHSTFLTLALCPPVDRSDLDGLAMALPEVTQEGSDDLPEYAVHGKPFVAWRAPSPDVVNVDTGEQMPDVICITVPGPEDEAAILALGEPWFTTPHPHGQDAVLVRERDLGTLDYLELAETAIDAWATRAPKKLVKGYLG